MPYLTARDLKEDILARANESLTGSQFNDRALDYINRAYQTIVSGASELLPEYIDDWYWHRATAVLNIEPAVITSVTLVNGSAAGVFATAPAASLVNWRVSTIGEYPDKPTITAHVAATTDFTLDSPWTGASGTYSAHVMRVKYDLDTSVICMLGPARIFYEPFQIGGIHEDAMDREYPLAKLTPGIPQAFSLIDEDTIRFSHGGRDDGISVRMEYAYKPALTLLTDSSSSIPIVPERWRHVIADAALGYLMNDKQDERGASVAMIAKSGLAAMVKESRRRTVKTDHNFGQIFPRPVRRA